VLYTYGVGAKILEKKRSSEIVRVRCASESHFEGGKRGVVNNKINDRASYILTAHKDNLDATLADGEPHWHHYQESCDVRVLLGKSLPKGEDAK